MGILCSLTVTQGAVPGATAAYERKIRELAARADLQKALQEKRKQQEQEKKQLQELAAASMTKEEPVQVAIKEPNQEPKQKQLEQTDLGEEKLPRHVVAL